MVSPSVVRLSTVALLGTLAFQIPYDSLFSIHPLAVSATFISLYTEGIIAVKQIKSAKTLATRTTLLNKHALLQWAGFIGNALSLWAIWFTKNRNAKPHFATLHGKLGILVFSLSALASLGGSAINLKLLPSSLPKRQAASVHGLLGLALLVLGYIELFLGLQTSFGTRVFGPFASWIYGLWLAANMWMLLKTKLM